MDWLFNITNVPAGTKVWRDGDAWAMLQPDGTKRLVSVAKTPKGPIIVITSVPRKGKITIATIDPEGQQ
jgi:hypothetical protein